MFTKTFDLLKGMFVECSFLQGKVKGFCFCFYLANKCVHPHGVRIVLFDALFFFIPLDLLQLNADGHEFDSEVFYGANIKRVGNIFILFVLFKQNFYCCHVVKVQQNGTT